MIDEGVWRFRRARRASVSLLVLLLVVPYAQPALCHGASHDRQASAAHDAPSLGDAHGASHGTACHTLDCGVENVGPRVRLERDPIGVAATYVPAIIRYAMLDILSPSPLTPPPRA